jgi:hypothetical protein
LLLSAAAGLSTVYIPTYKALGAMWLGAGIGFAASLPVYLLYAGDGGPPAKRGLIFSGVVTTLGIGAGALFTLNSQDSVSADTQPQFARIYVSRRSLSIEAPASPSSASCSRSRSYAEASDRA